MTTCVLPSTIAVTTRWLVSAGKTVKVIVSPTSSGAPTSLASSFVHEGVVTIVVYTAVAPPLSYNVNCTVAASTLFTVNAGFFF